ncbi:hypothetical protein GCM10008171_21020 [Methylopila jiangsuensis]|uniref:Ketosynthase family 3 (KS3) domain-containing protein n=1 Tax=Methylopila jiangsuensis TaxID=586230 RepID=A0A9W6JII2_9HYPH|nr:polyketide synthase [Methylopila jiangsuensis]MDR6286804.1 polyketide synthase PksN [Methylopila jiangsuensis]GLK76848.1 hypothetical protein GCM10008171_21020 [Methylopila jiangsuensis]
MTAARAFARGGLAPMAIVGMHGRFPGAPDLAAFWDNLEAGRDVIGRVPSDRWDWRAVHGTRSGDGETSYSSWGGFADHVDCFDGGFFGLLPKEVQSMDPQQRLFLQTAHNALEDAGIGPRSLAGRKVGVFVGVGNADYPALMREHGAEIDAYRGTGMALTAIANRISYLFDLRGPSSVVDTACSGSLVALHRAVTSLREGECELAIVGGVNLLLGPELYVAFSKAEMLSPTGRCRAFDAAADGYVRGEGVAAVVVRPLEAALDAGDYVYAVVEAVAENHGGRAHGFTAPNPSAQADVIADAWRKAGRPLSEAAFVETHGTGTPLGDPIEIEGLKLALARSSPSRRETISLGSLKSQIGHLEAAAGIASLIKAALSLQRGRLPANMHHDRLNPRIDLDGAPFRVASRETALNRLGDEPLAAGVSSFGFGGVNAHAVLREFRAPRGADGQKERDRRPFLIALSGKDAAGLRARAAQLVATLRAVPGASERERIARLLGEALALDVSGDTPLAAAGVTPGRLSAALEQAGRSIGAPVDLETVRDCVTFDDLCAAIAARGPVPGAETEDGETARLLCAAALPAADVAALDLARLSRALLFGRDAMSERLALVAGDTAELVEALSCFLAAPASDGPWVRSSVRGRGETVARPEALASEASADDLWRWARYWAAVRTPDIAWPELYPDLPLPPKTPLPAYPFALRRVWYRARDRSGAGREAPPSSPAVLRERTPEQGSIHAAWRECWAAAVRPLPSSLTAAPTLIDRLAARGGVVALSEVLLARPADFSGEAIVREAATERVAQCVAPGSAPWAALEARMADGPALAMETPRSDPIGSISGADFYGLCSAAGVAPGQRHRPVRQVRIGRDTLEFELDLRPARDASFWTQLTVTATLGAAWLLDPALSADALPLPWRVRSLRFDSAASEPVARMSFVRSGRDAVAFAALGASGAQVLTVGEWATRRFALPRRPVAGAEIHRIAS